MLLRTSSSLARWALIMLRSVLHFWRIFKKLQRSRVWVSSPKHFHLLSSGFSHHGYNCWETPSHLSANPGTWKLNSWWSLAPAPVSPLVLSDFHCVGQQLVSLDRQRASVDHGTWYVFWKLWPTDFIFAKCIFQSVIFRTAFFQAVFSLFPSIGFVSTQGAQRQSLLFTFSPPCSWHSS